MKGVSVSYGSISRGLITYIFFEYPGYIFKFGIPKGQKREKGQKKFVEKIITKPSCF